LTAGRCPRPLSLIFNAFLKVPMQFLILAIGVLLFIFYTL